MAFCLHKTLFTFSPCISYLFRGNTVVCLMQYNELRDTPALDTTTILLLIIIGTDDLFTTAGAYFMKKVTNL